MLLSFMASGLAAASLLLAGCSDAMVGFSPHNNVTARIPNEVTMIMENKIKKNLSDFVL